MSSHLTSTETPLERPVFRRLWVSLTISRLGDEFTVLALLWFTLQLTGSGTAIGLVFLCFQIPTILTSPLIGRLLDRYQPRLVMGTENFCRALIMMGFPVLHWLGFLQLWHIYAIALLAGALSPATEISVPVMTPHLVGKNELEKANASLSMVWEIATLIGPGIGGILVDQFGGPMVILFDAITFLVMGFVAFSLPDIKTIQTERSLSEGTGWLGFRTLFNLKAVRLLTAFELFLLFIQGLQSVAISVYSKTVLGGSATEYGFLLSAFGMGSVLGLILMHRFLVERDRPGLILAFLVILFGVLVSPLAFLKNLFIAMLCLIAAGIIAAPFFPIEQTAVQRLVPTRLRGEVFGVRGALGISGYPLGGAMGGLLLDYFSAPMVIGLSALACITSGFMGLLSPSLRGLTRDSEISQ
jgi:predicted MFS family arabinose efflux permease